MRSKRLMIGLLLALWLMAGSVCAACAQELTGVWRETDGKGGQVLAMGGTGAFLLGLGKEGQWYAGEYDVTEDKLVLMPQKGKPQTLSYGFLQGRLLLIEEGNEETPVSFFRQTDLPQEAAGLSGTWSGKENGVLILLTLAPNGELIYESSNGSWRETGLYTADATTLCMLYDNFSMGLFRYTLDDSGLHLENPGTRAFNTYVHTKGGNDSEPLLTGTWLYFFDGKQAMFAFSSDGGLTLSLDGKIATGKFSTVEGRMVLIIDGEELTCEYTLTTDTLALHFETGITTLLHFSKN